jgi:hypothetical protein
MKCDARQGKRTQDKTRQDNVTQDKARQQKDKTRQDKTILRFRDARVAQTRQGQGEGREDKMHKQKETSSAVGT